MAKKKKPQTDKEISLVVNETEEITQGLEPLTLQMAELDMEVDENYETLLGQGRVVRETQRQIQAKQKWAVSGMQEAIKRVKSLFVPMLNVCQEALELVDTKQSEYSRIQDERQRLEQERLDQEAEAERKRLRKNLLAKAQRAEKKGDEYDAVVLRSEASYVEVKAQQVEKEPPPKVDGVSVAKIWDFEIEDAHLIPRTVKTDLEVVVLWTRFFERKGLLIARASGIKVPGVRFFQKDSTRYGRL